MNNRTYALLVIVALALAVAPLRGLLAFPAPSATDETPHCMQMQGDSMDHLAGLPDTTPEHPGHGCAPGCGGDCCNGACGACVHVAVALPTVIAAGSHGHNGILHTVDPQRFAGRTVHPPYRPPISLPS